METLRRWSDRLFFGHDRGSMRIARWRWTLKRALLRTARVAATGVPGAPRRLGLDGMLFVDDIYDKYVGSARCSSSAAKALGFAPRCSVEEGAWRTWRCRPSGGKTTEDSAKVVFSG
jgi:hypothetical protein